MKSNELAIAITEILRAGGVVPVPLRAVIAATLMSERGGAPTRNGMAKVGGFSYGSSQNHYSDLLSAIVEELPRVLADMGSGGWDPVLAAKLRSDLQDRDATIKQLRSKVAELTDSQKHVRRYALALHERVRELDAQAAAESGKKVSPLRPLP
ncbi:hypothetical protein [Arthrobacter sp. efr-133-TYG-120]|uniref:hypothetical protein n=1 Tax=Arthrobacter sp. efr-133-TYG-120 TaxID=3040280 RepID=UPI00255111D5|nr:hypothetical protein [Arthrobacter sp. efr-133-TYG-120]